VDNREQFDLVNGPTGRADKGAGAGAALSEKDREQVRDSGRSPRPLLRAH
jgi:hypothetical protein